MHGSLGPLEFAPKQHLDRINRFCRTVTNTQIDHATLSLPIARIYVCERCALKTRFQVTSIVCLFVCYSNV